MPGPPQLRVSWADIVDDDVEDPEAKAYLHVLST